MFLKISDFFFTHTYFSVVNLDFNPHLILIKRHIIAVADPGFTRRGRQP